jgi:hypothetical protein
MRYGTVEGNPRIIRRYLPSNYQSITYGHYQNLVIGSDMAGWTFEYVRDRLASGLYGLREIDPLGYLMLDN